MDTEKYNKIYTAGDIQKYHSKKLSPAEMHAMEKAAQEDAFLAEAMEGYQETEEKDWEDQLKILNSHFKEKQAATILPRRLLPPDRMWKSVAAILLLCSGVAITYILTIKNEVKDHSIAEKNTNQESLNAASTEQLNVDKVAKSITPAADTAKIVEQIIVTKAAQKPLQESTSRHQSKSVIKKKEHSVTENNILSDQQKVLPDLISTNAAKSAQLQDLEDLDTRNNKVNNQPSKDTDYFKVSGIKNGRIFTAQVVATDGTPLPFANIRYSDDEPGTYTDARGKLLLKSIDSLLNIKIKSVGHKSENFTLNSDVPSAKLVLTADDHDLKEITVTGYGTKRKNLPMPDLVPNVIPVDGWDNYNSYLINNIFVSNKILQKKIHGEVLISFNVQSDGTLTNFLIENSLCEACDMEALRLVKEGPLWKVINSNKPTGEVKVIF